MTLPVITLGPFLENYGPIRYPRTSIKINGKNAAYVTDHGRVIRTNARADRHIAAIEAFVAEQIASGALVVKTPTGRV